MNRSSDPNATDPFAWSAEHLRRLVSLTSGAVTSIFSNGARPKIATGRGSAAYQVMRDAKLPSDISLPPARSLRDCATDSCVTTQEVDTATLELEPSLAPVAVVHSRWNEQVGAAKLAWNRVSESELLASEGNEQKLAVLVQEHYFISNAEASKRVKTFFGKQIS